MPNYSYIVFDMRVTSLTYDWQQEEKKKKERGKEGKEQLTHFYEAQLF